MMADNVEAKKTILQRINKHVGGGFGWFGIAIGLCLMAGGIAALALNPGMTAVSATTVGIAASSAVGLSVLTAGAAIGLGVAGLVLGVAIIAAIFLYPVIKEKYLDKITQARNDSIRQDEIDRMPEEMEKARKAQLQALSKMGNVEVTDEQRRSLLERQSSDDEYVLTDGERVLDSRHAFDTSTPGK